MAAQPDTVPRPRPRRDALALSPFARRTVRLWVAGVALFLALLALLALAGFELDRMTGDAVALLGAPVETGALSRLGTVLWGAGAGVAFATALVGAGGPGWRAYLFTLAAGLAFLACDDAFMLHEIVVPEATGLPEEVVLGAWVVAGIAWLVRCAPRVHPDARALLALAVVAFAVSLFVDELHVSEASEDVFKVIGVATVVAVVVVEALRARNGGATER